MAAKPPRLTCSERFGAFECRADDTVLSSSVGRRDLAAEPPQRGEKGAPEDPFLWPPGGKNVAEKWPQNPDQIPVPRTGKWAPEPFYAPQIPARFFPKFQGPAANSGPARGAAHTTGAPLSKRRPCTERRMRPQRPGACRLKEVRRDGRSMGVAG